jgi:hypothetical protein
MAKVSVVDLGKARSVPLPQGCSGKADTLAFVDGEKQPIHLHLHTLARGGALRIGPRDTDCVGYVWDGVVEVGGHRLEAGSSIIVEHGESVALTGVAPQSRLLAFAAAEPPSQPRAGGHVHLLPKERVPRLDDLGGGTGVGGAMHADSGCPTCEVWLHENHFPARPALSVEEQARGIHSHSEDEIIFVTSGEIRLGAKAHGPGTAVAIAADTLYSFSPGPDGMSFINFRAARPGDIQFANGMAISETGYWRERLPRPEYLEPRVSAASQG